MSDYSISQVYSRDRRSLAEVEALLASEGLSLDANLDYTAAMYDEHDHVIATGSCFGPTLRCFAVSREHQGEGLLNRLLTHLLEVQCARGNLHLFLYTKIDSAKFFADLGFYEIARVADKLVFMENRRDGFKQYLENLVAESEKDPAVPANAATSVTSDANAPANTAATQAAQADPANATAAAPIGALVMNCNPFTLGHQYLVESAAAQCRQLHLFVVSEDASLVPYAVRRQLIEAGTAHIPGITLHATGPYIISSATFPSYFLKDESDVISGQARLDAQIFSRIAHTLGITDRFVGDEPTSTVTRLYNQIMAEELPKNGLKLHIIPRKEAHGKAISASTVRQALQQDDWALLADLLPPTSLEFFRSPAAAPIINKIKASDNVVHY